MDLSNSKFLRETPDFSAIPNLERLDFSGFTHLLYVHSSIGLLKKLAFLSLQNCSNLVRINFGYGSNLISLTVLRFSGCTKLETTPDFTSAENLKYLDFDGCASLSLVHESIGSLLKLTLLSLRDCSNLVSIPSTINAMTSLQTLDLCSCLKLNDLPVGQSFNSKSMASLIVLDLSFCNLHKVPDDIGVLTCLERLNLQGNKFDSIPSIMSLHRLAYLNLSHCYNLVTFSEIPPLTGYSSEFRPSSGGRYFKTVSGSRDHRSGLYIYDCPMHSMEHVWFGRLIEYPSHFRCGFDIVVPWLEKVVPQSFQPELAASSIIRIKNFNANEDWLGFVFYAVFEVNDIAKVSPPPHCSFSSSPVLHPIYLSFESEHTEEYFNIPIDFKPSKIVRSDHLWVIYISREHCHFVKTGAHITFKSQPGFKIIKWGLRSIFKQDFYNLQMDLCIIDDLERKYIRKRFLTCEHPVDFDDVTNDMTNPEPKIRLPYNWLVTEKDEVENIEAKTKENNLSNVGL
ncbi:hypothetical protein Fmac_021498 [Flemingia macrophylla]|uniref:Uncharacterized protein n=1 Tax=Flemingia macrophylla TaxID=520843 RepID=A0ABD1LX63_9FABA